MDVSSKPACSPFFGCHFRSKTQFKTFCSKIFIFGGLPINKPATATEGQKSLTSCFLFESKRVPGKINIYLYCFFDVFHDNLYTDAQDFQRISLEEEESALSFPSGTVFKKKKYTLM